MLSFVLWILGPILESLIIIRGVRGNFLNEYGLFYLYVLWVFVRDISLFAVYYAWSSGYAYVYWYSQFFSILVGCGVEHRCRYVRLSGKAGQWRADLHWTPKDGKATVPLCAV